VVALALIAPAAAAGGSGGSGGKDPVSSSQRLRQNVTVGGILAHQRVFQRIANTNGGTRASGTPGYDASVAYVASRLERAGYDVTLQEFTFPFFRELEPATLAQVSPTPTEYATGTFDYSGTGDVTGALVPTNDVLIPPPAEPGSTSGCEPEDFVPASATEPQVALIQRGTCTFEQKAVNAQAAGYDAVIIFNEGQPGRTDLFIGTLGNPMTIPVVGLSFADASALYAQTQAGEVVVHVTTSTEADLDAVTHNVIADSPGGDPEKTVVVGAHLDSVVAGAGINDNGSGSATILEIAEEIAELGYTSGKGGKGKGKLPKQRNQLRFAFWGAEEAGLLGSEHYVAQLSDDELSEIAANLNFDMVGSTNYVRFVYDGDGSDTEPEGPPGSGAIEEIFTSYFESQDLASAPTEFSGRSDYGPFIAVGIPAGGLFTGAEGIKTEEQAEIFGGTAGVAYDPCYHQPCDDITNLSTRALSEMGDAAAHSVWTLGMTKTGLFEDGSLRVGARAMAAAPELAYKGPHAVR
jgi:Zn-dependent M28 family amino/carboxypeptidase